MKLIHDADTDALYVDLKEGRGEESEEVASGFVLDFDAEGNAPGIDMDSEASKKTDLSRLETEGLQISPAPSRPQEPGQSKAV